MRGGFLFACALQARRLWLCETAVTAVEFALLSPVFFAATLMLLELGLYELYAASLSYATQMAARQILVGNVANSTQPVNITNFINNYLCPNLPPPMTCSRVIVNSQALTANDSGTGGYFNSWTPLFNAGPTGLAPVQMDNTKTTFCIGGNATASGPAVNGTSTAVALEVFYAMPFWSIPFMSTPTTTYNGSPVIWIVSTAAFRNEPFTSTYTGC